MAKPVPDPVTPPPVRVRPIIGPQWEATPALRRLVARGSQEYALKAQAEIMSEQDLAMVRQWAAASPNTDIRATASLAFMGIGIESKSAQDVAAASVAASIDDGTYANVVGIPGNGVTKGANRAAIAAPDDHTAPPEESWWQTALDNVVPDPGNEFWDNVMPDPTTGVGGFIGEKSQPVQAVSRWVLTGFQSGLDAGEAVIRTSSGAQEDLNKIGEKYGLTTEQQKWVANTGGTSGDENTPDKSNLASELPGIGIAGAGPVQAKTPQQVWDEATPEQRDAMTKAKAEWQANDKSNTGKQVALAVDQIALGQAVQDPSLINSDSGSWLPTQEIEVRKEKAALEARDIRTAEEIARGVEPTAWTPGRGIAHLWWSPDEEAFHTWSGVVDFNKSIFLDPVNFIPVGAAGNIARSGVVAVARSSKTVPLISDAARGSKAALRAGIASSDKAVVVTDALAVTGAAQSRRGAAAVAAAKADGSTYVTDDIFKSRNVTIKEDGRVTGPYGQFLARREAWTWLNSGKGMRVVDDLAGRTSAYDIWKRSGGERGGMSWELAQQLSDAQTPAAVRAILASRIGVEIDDAGQLTKFGQSPVRMAVSTTARNSKMGEWITRQGGVAARGNVISINDPDTLARELDAFGTAAKVSHEEMATAMDAIMRAPDGASRYAAIYQDFFRGVIKDRIVANGVDESDAYKLVSAYEGGLDQSQRLLWNEGTAFGGGPSSGFPTIMSESLSDVISLPSYREILRATSMMRKVRATAMGEEASLRVGDILNDISSNWRNLVLFRPAYTLREVGEMSFSMSLSGYDSMFAHPLQAVAMATHIAAINASKTAAGNLLKVMASGSADPMVRAQLRNEYARAHEHMVAREMGAGLYGYAKVGVKRGTYEAARIPMASVQALDSFFMMRGMGQLHPYLDPTMARVTGDGMLDELNRFQATGDRQHLTGIADAMSVTHGNYIQDQASKSFGSTVKAIGRPDLHPGQEQDYAKAVADRLRRGSEDPEIRNIARTGSDPAYTMDDVEIAYQSGTKAEKHIMFQNSRGAEEWANPAVKSDRDYLNAQEEVLRMWSGGDTDLIEAVHKGTYGGKPIGSDNEAFVAKVRSTVEQNTAGFPETVGLSVPDGGKIQAKFDQVTTDFFQNTAAFSDVFARGPIVRQAYVKRVLQLGTDMSPAAKAEVVANLRNAGDIGLARQVQSVKATGGLSVEEVDSIAAGFARSEVQRIFYDAAKRQNWALALRVASPFAQATMNTFKRWGLMSVQNPQSYYRSMKPLIALQQPGSAALYDLIGGITGDPDMERMFDAGRPSLSEANGFFFSDRYGERKFVYPGVGPIAKLLGAPAGAGMGIAALENLNVAGTSFNPGFGPAVTLAASFGLGDAINEKSFKGDMLRMMWPYGYPDDSQNPLDKIMNATLPTMYKKIIQAMDPNSTTRMNTSVATLSGLINTGDYDMQDSADVTRLMNDADSLASRLGLWSAVLGSMTPSTFSPGALIETKSTDPEKQAQVAQWVFVDKLMEEYQKYTKDDYKTGTLNFVDDFGGSALFSALPRTKTDAIAQATNDMWQFRTDNPESYNNHIAVIGLFMSNDDLNSNFSRELFMEQRQKGTRGYMKLNGPGGYAEKANEAIGWMLWNKGTADIDRAVGEDEEKRARLRSLMSEDLTARYPGFSPSAKDTGKNVELYEKIREALNDPAIQTLPSAYYADRYLRQRDAALAALREKTGDINSLGVKGATPVARQLWLLGQQYANEDTTGGFRHMWNRVLSQELDPYGPVTEEVAK